LDFYNWGVTVDNYAFNFIKKLFDFYLEDDTLVVISNVVHETTVNCFNNVKHGMIIDHLQRY